MIQMPITRERSVQELLFYWPTVTRRANDDWTKGFAGSIAKASRRRNWRPTPKQLGVMQRLVAGLFAQADDDLQVVE